MFAWLTYSKVETTPEQENSLASASTEKHSTHPMTDQNTNNQDQESPAKAHSKRKQGTVPRSDDSVDKEEETYIKRQRSHSQTPSSLSWLESLGYYKSSSFEKPSNDQSKPTTHPMNEPSEVGSSEPSYNRVAPEVSSMKPSDNGTTSSRTSEDTEMVKKEDLDNKQSDDMTSQPLQPNNTTTNGIWSWFGYVQGNDTSSTSLPVPVKGAPEEQASASHHPEQPAASVQPPKSNWKSFFFTSSSKQDSVIIDPTPANPQESSQENQPPNLDETSSEKTLPVAEKKPQKNIVLPTFQSQFIPAADTGASASLFTKAMSAINNMFINNKHNTNQLEHFIHAVRSDPENFGQKSFVVIGVHGWFPMKLVRSMVGEPTGTSARFCEMMVLSLKRYFETEHQLTIPDQCITVIPLEWEGKVEDRVENLYRILLENEAWVTALKAADMVLWATHSQGTPVSTMLLHKLIDAAYIQVPRQSVCLLAMAGISHGPFPYLKGSIIVKYFEADAARELFDFMDSNSDISTKFRMSMAYILRQNVKTVLVGSMQDQVVPLYSAIMSGTSHPNILRAIYIDGHIFSENDFLINLITLALRLRNAGFSDHGLLTHISEVLAGNLYSWEGGHSTIYDELGVYTIAIRYLFETQPLGKRKLMEPRSPASTVAAGAAVASSNHVTPRTTKVAAVEPKLDQFNAKVRLNPFYLPWAMRGIYDDARVQGDEFFHRELLRLQDLFDRWQPSSSKLKEIKFRLEPLKARL